MSPKLLPRLREAEHAVEAVDLPWNRYGIDPFGVSKRHLSEVLTAFGHAYRRYFRVRTHGIDNVPSHGRAMIVGNHSGGVALDAAMIITSLLLDARVPRLAHGMAERFLARMPFVSEWASRCGQLTGLPEHARRLLEDERLLLVFPEGASGTAKLFGERHDLVRFGTGFVRLALETASPIVPVAFLGGGEAVPTVVNSYRLGRLLGVPYIPFTPYGLPVPLPVRLDILFGPRIRLEGDGSENDEVIAEHVELIRRRIAELYALGRKYRQGDVTEAGLRSVLSKNAP